MPNENIIRNRGRNVITKKGDTVWAQTARVLQDRLGRKPTNAEINSAMRRGVTVPSGDINKIRPGDRTRIPSTAEAAGRNRTLTTRGQRADSARYAGQAAPRKAATTRGQRADSARYAGQAAPRKAATTKKAATVKKQATAGSMSRGQASGTRGRSTYSLYAESGPAKKRKPQAVARSGSSRSSATSSYYGR